MSCDLQKLLTSARANPALAGNAPREPSPGERLIQDLLRHWEESERQIRRIRAEALGYYGVDLHTSALDALEMMQRNDQLFGRNAYCQQLPIPSDLPLFIHSPRRAVPPVVHVHVHVHVHIHPNH